MKASAIVVFLIFKASYAEALISYEIPSISVIQAWHERSHKDPAHAWLHQMIYKTCQEID